MTKLRLFTGFLILLSLPVPLHAAPDLGTAECTEKIYASLAREQRLYRSVVYGSPKAENLPVNNILYDTEGNGWIKKTKGSWTMIPSSGTGTDTAQKSDDAMDDAKDTPTRIGILETKRSTTSDLIPALTQSLRALQCRLRAVCGLAIASQDPEKDAETLTIETEGCIDFKLPPIKECSVADGVSPALIVSGSCSGAADALFTQESTVLNLSVAYDSAYRSIAQFSGMFEGFLTEFRFPLLNPLWQTVRVLGGLKNIPCFLSQCEE